MKNGKRTAKNRCRSGPAAVLLALAVALAWPPAGGAGQLVPPPGFAAPVKHKEREAQDCPDDAEPYTGALDFPSKYEGSDKARDDLNPRAEKKYRKLTAPISALEKGVSRQVEDYLRAGQEDSLRCALGLLTRWSQARGLEGDAKTHTGKAMRKWALGSVAAAYARLKFSATQPLRHDPATAERIEAWLARLAERVVADWNNQPIDKVNNHEYWAAWSVMVAAVALDRRDLFDWSAQQYRVAAAQIDGSGYLPNELKRDTRALYYHNYALTPLAMMAAFAKANGVDLAAQNQYALQRLAARVLAGIENPAGFEARTGNKQNVSEFAERSKFAWLEPYCWTLTCEPALMQRLSALRPLRSHRLGGNVTELFAPQPVVSAGSGNRSAGSGKGPPVLASGRPPVVLGVSLSPPRFLSAGASSWI